MKTKILKNILAISSVVIIAACGTAKATDSAIKNVKSVDCPTNALKGLSGTFKGVLSAVTFQGESQPLQNIMETQTIVGCTSFDFDIHYSDPQTGKETRQVKFSAQWNKAKGLFKISRSVIEGEFRVIREGQFLASFETSFAGNPAHCEEMMTLTNSNKQLMRSVQCAAGDVNGSSLGVRNALVSRLP